MKLRWKGTDCTDLRRLQARNSRRVPSVERGAAIVEMALAMPVALTVLTALLTFGVYINKELELANATSLAGEYLSVNRGVTSDPCALTVSSFTSVAPFLDPTAATFSFVLNGTSYPSTTSCKAGAANLVQGATATITVTYPCSLAIYGANLVPSCNLTSQITEIIQ